MGLEIAFSSSVLSPEVKGQVGNKMEQSLERVNPSPSPTHSARESEWAKADAVLNATTRRSRETELIWGGTHGHYSRTIDGLTVRPAGPWFMTENFPRTQSENLAKSRLTDRPTVRGSRFPLPSL
ncbi:hypothetical protein MTR67_002429 [Solanum verrucosum]|uniref:Uncharacterized protein n=1 Tax=Solanum verrucosum TaxID=315347 RepID=A0AAF0PQ39_SOLVR|nr:hypothetical protein MTR67_002429 [Solanum verrucosum]